MRLLVSQCSQGSTARGALWRASHRLTSNCLRVKSWKRNRESSLPAEKLWARSLCWLDIWSLEVLTFGKEMKHFPITVKERISQVFIITLKLILWFLFFLGLMELHIGGSKFVPCMCPISFSRIIGVQGMQIGVMH